MYHLGTESMFLIEVEFNNFAQTINLIKITLPALGINGVMGVNTRLVTLLINTNIYMFIFG